MIFVHKNSKMNNLLIPNGKGKLHFLKMFGNTSFNFFFWSILHHVPIFNLTPATSVNCIWRCSSLN